MADFILPKGVKIPSKIGNQISQFLQSYKTFENENKIPHLILKDNKSDAYYLICHIKGSILISRSDTDAVLDPFEGEDYKLNRDIYTDSYAYKKMEVDATKGRSFEDIVIEYDTSYKRTRPLKVYGGQHRIQAIKEAANKGIDIEHGIRVYFGLTRDQRLDIAIANNTAIAVSNDLLDRMQEEHLGTELRDWCQKIGLLNEGENIADKRSPEGIPTVRNARTLVLNYYLGMNSNEDEISPKVTKSGPGIDEDYIKIRDEINWNDKNIERMGFEFTKLHKLQRERVLTREQNTYIEYANKALHPTVTASWAFSTGYLETHHPENLVNHFALSEESDDDPLNAVALNKARLKSIDPDTYRGIGTRISRQELGRTFEVFYLHASQKKRRGITLKLANAAIKSYEGKKLIASRDKDLERA